MLASRDLSQPGPTLRCRDGACLARSSSLAIGPHGVHLRGGGGVQSPPQVMAERLLIFCVPRRGACLELSEHSPKTQPLTTQPVPETSLHPASRSPARS